MTQDGARPRVVVTGLGVVSPLGNDVASTWQGLRDGRSGITRITTFDASEFDSQIAGEVKDFDPLRYMERKEVRRNDRFTQFALATARQALDDAKLDIERNSLEAERTGVTWGSGIGGVMTLVDQVITMVDRGHQRVSPFTIPMMIIDMGAGAIAMQFGAKGPNLAHVSACASSAHAVGEAADLIRRGQADVMLAGGSEAGLIPIAIAAFSSMRALSTRNDAPEQASRPFDKLRDGFVFAEGGACLILEGLEHARRRGARIYAELIGYGLSSDAHHVTAPPEGAEGAARAMRMALADAAIGPAEVDYINAHGTSTPANDGPETRAIKAVFGQHAYKLAVSSTKSMTGHTLGAAGALEAAICVLAMRDGVLPPTINQEVPDPECDLDYVPNRSREREIRVSLSNSMGFGGHNAVLILRRWDMS